jgi:hypothetical protein
MSKFIVKVVRFNKLVESPDLFLFLLFCFVLFWYSLFGSTFVTLKLSTQIEIFIFILLFTVTYRGFSFLFSIVSSKKIKPFIHKEYLYGISIILFFLVLYKFVHLVMSSGAHSALDFREFFAGVDDGEAKTISAGIGFPFLIASYYTSYKQEDVRWCKLFLFLSLIVAALSTAKIFILLFIIFVVSVNNFKINIKNVAVMFVVGFLFFGLSSVILKKYSNDGGGNLFLAVLNTFNVYLLSGLAAFQNILDGIKPDINGWMQVGDWHTNVYSGFQVWFELFKDYYYMVSGVFLGFYYSVFINKNKLLNQLFSFYSVFLLYPLFMLVFADQFIGAIKMHLAFVFCSITVSLVKCKRVEYVKG